MLSAEEKKRRRAAKRDQYNAARRAKYAENRSIILERNRQWRAANPEKIARRNRRYWKANSDCLKQSNYLWREANPGRNAELAKKWARENPERARANVQRFREANPNYSRDRYRSDAEFNIACRLRARLAKALRAAGLRKAFDTFDLVGCDLATLVARIAAQFVPGMSWENRELWHVDHKRPICTFDLTDLEQQRAAFHYTNLRPLWAPTNLARPRSLYRSDEQTPVPLEE